MIVVPAQGRSEPSARARPTVFLFLLGWRNPNLLTRRRTMKLTSQITLVAFPLFLAFAGWYAFGQPSANVGPSPSPPKLPMNIPPPPNFGSFSSKTGKYQLVSAEYYSQDEKPYLYKRLIKFDTTTGEAWVLYSKLGASGERRTWVPLVEGK